MWLRCQYLLHSTLIHYLQYIHIYTPLRSTLFFTNTGIGQHFNDPIDLQC